MANVDVIVTGDIDAARVLADTTKSIPIVAALRVDPEGKGLVRSLIEPGSNLTGVFVPELALVPKRLELLREILPGSQRISVVFDPDTTHGQTVWELTPRCCDPDGHGSRPYRNRYHV